MSGNQDADIKLLTIVDDGTQFSADTLTNGLPFEVSAQIEIGKDLMRVVTKHELFVTIHNVTQQSVLVPQVRLDLPLTAQDGNTPYVGELRARIDTWKAEEGDVLRAIATYKVTAGVFRDFSTASSQETVVQA
ncbi:hypothetical protein J2S43_002816 [Catenuloplanes nepalensis]|uniref:Uncharacterized protein n=1 Tax=Catenuloplanes nepalensis TaxID=587533 RepID=A0ABT9MS86_9ACTN|nr:hypothetical protein [Catenuloplanes nepalensis]MDP9794304.1 hypothetical protein [Catenuloplanes nepalensis]